MPLAMISTTLVVALYGSCSCWLPTYRPATVDNIEDDHIIHKILDAQYCGYYHVLHPTDLPSIPTHASVPSFTRFLIPSRNDLLNHYDCGRCQCWWWRRRCCSIVAAVVVATASAASVYYTIIKPSMNERKNEWMDGGFYKNMWGNLVCRFDFSLLSWHIFSRWLAANFFYWFYVCLSWLSFFLILIFTHMM